MSPDEQQFLGERRGEPQRGLRSVGDVEVGERLVDVDAERPVSLRCLAQPPHDSRAHQSDGDDERDRDRRPVADGGAPRVDAADAEHGLFHEVGEVVLSDVDPPFLGELDDDPDERGEPDDGPVGEATRVRWRRTR